VRNLNGPAPALVNSMKIDNAQQVLLFGYPDSSGRSVPAVVAQKVGGGEVVICLMNLKERLSRRARYTDPACRRLVVDLIVGD
jgi:hypothetical protein